MYVCKLPYVIFRDYPEYGYLTDNRNFGYDTNSKSCLKLGDLLISKMGSVFYSVLDKKPQEINIIVAKLFSIIEDVGYDDLFHDAVDFYNQLSLSGFVFVGDKPEQEFFRSGYFSYQNKDSIELVLPDDHVTSYNDVFHQDHRLTRVHIDISSRCNERCVHCYIPHELKRTTMSAETFMLILDQCRENNVLNVTISGGEPMLNPNLLFFLRKCREYNLSVNLLTNLTLLSDELLEEFVRNPLLSVQTSLYSMDPEIHDSITMHKGSHKKTLDAIVRLYENNIPMQINCPVMKQNKGCYHKVVEWARQLNIDASNDYMLFGCYDCSKRNLDCRLNEDELEEVIIDLDLPSITKEFEERKQKSKTDHICTVCENSICVSNNGELYPCEGWQSFRLGNLREQSLYEIWEKSPQITFLRNIHFGDFEKCSSCVNKFFCNICLIRNVNESSTGNLFDINPYFCKVAEMKRKIYQSMSE